MIILLKSNLNVVRDQREIEDIRRITNIENNYKRKPSTRDISETVVFLKDFGIRIPANKIPDFKSMFDLCQWRKRVAVQHLTCNPLAHP